MIRNKVVWDKHYNSNRLTVRNIFLFCYSRFRLMCIFKVYQKYLATSIKVGCATRSLYASSGPKAEGVPTNNQRGRGSGPCRL